MLKIDKKTVGGLICEFNPMHKGHKYIVDTMKENGAVVCVMSGNFVQRGESAIIDKWTRAEMALECGADLVIELPFRFATAGAQKFAFGSVYLLNAIGFVDNLYFGCESGSSDTLQKLALLTSSDEFGSSLNIELEKGISFATARENAVKAMLKSDYNGELSGSNNNLAIEYIRALNELTSSITPTAVKRVGNSHDSLVTGELPSAMFIRSQLVRGIDVSEYLPFECSELLKKAISTEKCPTDFSVLDTAILAKLRMMKEDDFANLPDISEGIEKKLFKEVKNARSVTELYDLVKSKRFTHARIRRLVLHAFVGLTENPTPPHYIRLLGMSSEGAKLLSNKRNTLPILSRVADIESLSADAKADFNMECIADDIFGLCSKNVSACGDTYKKSLIKKN